jgi:hypothetical protein
LVDGVSEVETSSVFNNTTRKVIKYAFKHARLVSIPLYYTYTGVEVVDEAHIGASDLPDEGLAPSWDG